MRFHKLKDEVGEEIKNALAGVEEERVEKLINLILSARRVFVVGAGRVRLVMQAFAKRLKHLGLDTYVVGETTPPPITPKDVLIVGSGSGETIIPVEISKLAKKFKARVGLITSSPRSTLGELADVWVRIPSPTKLHLPTEPFSRQPRANLFEQSLFILCDCLIIILQEKLGISEEEMQKRHANLE